MNSKAGQLARIGDRRDWVDEAREVAREFGKRAVDYDRNGAFVAENFNELRARRFFSAGIPATLGGGNAGYAELCGIVREIGRHCGSTALTYAMHSHTVGANVYKHLRGDDTATETLTKIAASELIISTTGANDWLHSSGTAERVEGGYRVNARKHFVSGCPAADVLATSVTFQSDSGVEVLHFAIPRTSDGVQIIDTWDTIGMRGTGSNDVVYSDVFVPDRAIVGRRPAGQWHPMWEVILPTALPLICSAYVGLAEAATSLALEAAKRKGVELAGATGALLNTLIGATLALDDAIRLNDDHGFTPSVGLVNDILARKAIIAGKVKETVELAAELVGGPGFYRGHAMERIVRDIRALHYHPLPLRRQEVFSGRLALGLDPVGND